MNGGGSGIGSGRDLGVSLDGGKGSSGVHAVAEDSSGNGTAEKPVHKWPIRPGVHVHLNGLRALNVVASGDAAAAGGGLPDAKPVSGFTYSARNSGCSPGGCSSSAKSEGAMSSASSSGSDSSAASSSKHHNDLEELVKPSATPVVTPAVTSHQMTLSKKVVMARGTSTERQMRPPPLPPPPPLPSPPSSPPQTPLQLTQHPSTSTFGPSGCCSASGDSPQPFAVSKISTKDYAKHTKVHATQGMLKVEVLTLVARSPPCPGFETSSALKGSLPVLWVFYLYLV